MYGTLQVKGSLKSLSNLLNKQRHFKSETNASEEKLQEPEYDSDAIKAHEEAFKSKRGRTRTAKPTTSNPKSPDLQKSASSDQKKENVSRPGHQERDKAEKLVGRSLSEVQAVAKRRAELRAKRQKQSDNFEQEGQIKKDQNCDKNAGLIRQGEAKIHKAQLCNETQECQSTEARETDADDMLELDSESEIEKELCASNMQTQNSLDTRVDGKKNTGRNAALDTQTFRANSKSTSRPNSHKLASQQRQAEKADNGSRPQKENRPKRHADDAMSLANKRRRASTPLQEHAIKWRSNEGKNVLNNPGTKVQSLGETSFEIPIYAREHSM